MPLVLAQDTDVVVDPLNNAINSTIILFITEPTNLAVINDMSIILSAQMNELGNMSYGLDSQQFILACSNCQNFTTQIDDISEGQHTINVLAEVENESVIESVNFTITNMPNNDNLEVMITQPQNQQEFNVEDITLSAEMNKLGTMSYALDSNNFLEACIDCSDFSIVISDISDGTHQVSVMGETSNEIAEASVFFVVNVTSTPVNETPPAGNGTNQSGGDAPRFSLGFNKLPKQFVTGEISEYGLTEIINNNKLNPGVINRLAKTGKLSQENIDAIVNTQFLPPGILNKLLGLIGFARNTNLEEFIKNTNLTDSQFSTLIENNEIPDGTANTIINQYELEEKTIDSLISKEGEKILTSLVKKQTLSDNNIQKILETTNSEKLIEALIEHQVLEEENINKIVDYAVSQDSLINNQKLTKEQETKLNINSDKPKLIISPVVIGSQSNKQDTRDKSTSKEDRNKYDKSPITTNTESSENKVNKKETQSNKDTGQTATDSSKKSGSDDGGSNNKKSDSSGKTTSGDSKKSGSSDNKGNSEKSSSGDSKKSGSSDNKGNSEKSSKSDKPDNPGKGGK